MITRLTKIRTRVFFLFLLVIVGFWYRLVKIGEYSFWTDEEHVAIFARAILEKGRPVLTNGYSTGVYQWLQYWLSAISAKFFGLNEFAVRFPSVIFGVLTIWAVYLLGKELFANFSTSEEPNVSLRSTLPPSEVLIPLIAAVLTTFLNIEILWSRQARPYQALQFFYLLGAWFIYKLSISRNIFYLVGFLLSGILATLMHGLGLVIFFVGFSYLLIFYSFKYKKIGIGLILVILLIFSYIFRLQLWVLISQIGKTNNLFYYRVFLIHNYFTLVIFSGLGGLLLWLEKKYKKILLFALFLGSNAFIVSFLLSQPFTRYFYPVFPFLILLTAEGLAEILYFLRRNAFSLFSAILLFLTLFIVGMGHKFSLLPKQAYSLNEDMQETPEVDWKRIYDFVGQKLNQHPEAVLAVNWNDLPVWFLGEGKLDFLVRERGILYSSGGDPFSSALFVETLEDFKKIIKENKKGIFVLDSWDNRVPEKIREYTRENLKKELEIDRLYPKQPRYWPVEVFSWGMK